MAYRPRYRRRRTSRRRTLSSYHIATRTGARSQAKQIYALNRKVNYIQRMTKPEIKVFRSTQTPSSSPSDANYVSNVYNTMTSFTIEGSFARLLSYTGYFSANYATGMFNENVEPITIRLVIVQAPNTRSGSYGQSDVWNEDAYTTDGDTSTLTNFRLAVFGPLANGLARTAKVLCDKRFYLSYQRPQVYNRIVRKRLLNYLINDTEPVPKGRISCFVVSYSPASNLTYTWTLTSKIAYTDA